MKKIKYPLLAFVLLSILTIFWFFRGTPLSSVDLPPHAQKVQVIDLSQTLEDNNGEIGPSASEVLKRESSQNLEEEERLYQALLIDLPSFEQMNTDCHDAFENGHQWNRYPIESAGKFDADEVGELAFYFFNSISKMSEVPSGHYQRMTDFILEHDAVDTEKFFFFYLETTKTCVSQPVIQRLRNFIEKFPNFNWSEEARYKFSVIATEILRLVQYMPTPDRLILFINILESMDKAGILVFNDHSMLHDLRVKVEGIHQHLLDDMHNTRLSNEEKNSSLRNYFLDISIVAEELSMTATSNTNRKRPPTIPADD